MIIIGFVENTEKLLGSVLGDTPSRHLAAAVLVLAVLRHGEYNTE